ncbi:MAG: ABC transporter permease [Lachnospiraceae bacterium]|nr:ABC transporter permease [Lachnospiraceae bacterium]
MKKFINLTKRNCLVFLRDRAAVFFSLLAMLIVLMLMGVFLGNMNEENVVNLLKEYGGSRNMKLDQEHARELVQYWTLAGILVVNAVTVTLAVIGNRVTDVSEGKLPALYSAPVSRNIIALSYIMSAVLIGIVMCVITLGVSLGYIVATGGELPDAWALGRIFLLIVLNVCIFSIIMYFCALFIKSSSAWSGIATVVGTLVGFVGGIYLPMGNLPDGVAAVLKYIPILHGTSLMRKVCCEKALEKTFTEVPMQLISDYREYMGINITMGDGLVSSVFQILFIAGCGLTAFAVIMIVQKKNIIDR